MWLLYSLMALKTLCRVDRDVLMDLHSSSLSPTAPDALQFSLPARSIMVKIPYLSCLPVVTRS